MTVVTLAAPVALHASGLDSSLSGAGDEIRAAVEAALEHPRPWSKEDLLRIVSDAVRKAEGEGIRIRADVVARALDLLAVLPAHVPLPDLVIESDHEMGLDWDLGPRCVLAVTVDETSFLGFAALIGAEPTHGRIVFSGEIPETLLYLLSRTHPDRGHSF